MLHRLPQQGLVDLSREDLVKQLELPDLVSTEVHYVDVCHRLLSLRAIDAARLNLFVCFDRFTLRAEALLVLRVEPLRRRRLSLDA